MVVKFANSDDVVRIEDMTDRDVDVDDADCGGDDCDGDDGGNGDDGNGGDDGGNGDDDVYQLIITAQEQLR